MTSDELERVLEAALHRPDDQPVDLGQGRAELVRRLSQDQRARRLRIIGVAAGSSRSS
jgi:hypothetical protein